MTIINRRTVVLAHDLCVAALAWLLAWLARFNFSVPYPGWEISVHYLPAVILVQGSIFWLFGLYRGLWRFASLPDLWNIIRAAVLGVLAITLALFLVARLQGVPRSILILYPVFLIMLLGGPRLVYRMWKDHGLSLRSSGGAERVLIIGAGRAGEMLAREMLRAGKSDPIGFLDDDPQLRGTRVQGLPVFGGLDKLERVAREHDVSQIVIAIPSATNEQMQRIVQHCELAGMPLRTLPRLQDIVAGRAAVSDLRAVSIEDLLGREKAELDWQIIERGIGGKSILVSGGGGSIGAELCQQIAGLGPAALIVIERNEFNLYRVRSRLFAANPALKLHVILGDVCDPATVEAVLRRFRPQVIFHAAAHKHVPILEDQRREAVRNNILGTKSLAEAAGRHGCEKFILISTDKAVNPVSILGKTKRVAEILCDSMNGRTNTRYITVRFGNVLGSDGSVVPLFEEQIRAGGPVTVTHPEVQRYFMTIHEACQLILQAGAMGQGGEIFVLDMGKPVRIAYLAERMIRLAGLKPGDGIEIRYVGLRPGEKLAEELFHDWEEIEPTGHPKILRARHAALDWQAVSEYLEAMEAACAEFDEGRLARLLEELLGTGRAVSATAGKVVSLRPHQSS